MIKLKAPLSLVLNELNPGNTAFLIGCEYQEEERYSSALIC